MRCLTDGQISHEVDAFVSAHGLPRGIGPDYFVFTPANVGSCFDAGGSSCFDTDYCAYHSYNNTGGTTLYASQPYAPDDPRGCGTQ